MTELTCDQGVYRTAPAEQGLLITYQLTEPLHYTVSPHTNNGPDKVTDWRQYYNYGIIRQKSKVWTFYYYYLIFFLYFQFQSYKQQTVKGKQLWLRCWNKAQHILYKLWFEDIFRFLYIKFSRKAYFFN